MSYKKLRVYKLAHELGVDIHQPSLRLPKYELYETGSQVRRASKSVSANIVEGYGRRRYPADYLRFLTYAQSSCDETLEHIEYVLDCHQHLKEDWIELSNRCEDLGKQLNKFVEAIRGRG